MSWTSTHDRDPKLPVAEVRPSVLVLRVTLVGLAVAGVVLAYGWDTSPIRLSLVRLAQVGLLVVYGVDVWVGSRLGRRRGLHDHRPDWVEAALLAIAAVGAAAHAGSVVGGWHLLELAAGLLLLIELWQLNVGLSRWLAKPGLLLPISFLTMVAVGTPLLKVPMAVPAGQSITWLDALFTITSAVCVTGLVVRDTATQFTPYGQAVIGVFIQLGGLGIIVFGSMLAMILGNRLSLRDHQSLSRMLQDQPLRRVTSLVRFMVLTTLSLELAGALAMMTMWHGELALGHRVGLSLFHAVSAFCNAGFSLQSDGLESYRYALGVHLVMVPLWVIGGLGFPVLSNLWFVAWRRVKRGWPTGKAPVGLSCAPWSVTGRLSLHTKVVLTTTAVLYLYGVAGLVAGELKPYTDGFFQQGVTANRTPPEPLNIRRLGGIVADASFVSLSARTAGFHTVPTDELSPVGRLVVITLMMVGASPGGTGGGMKTTTLALLLLTVAATLRRRDHTEAFARRISEPLIRKAATVAVSLVALVTVATLLLRLSEPYPFEKILFEVVSAASTTGLSLGITGDLTAFGKMVIITTMFLGRVGPLALLGALFFRPTSPRLYTYPAEDVVMG